MRDEQEYVCVRTSIKYYSELERSPAGRPRFKRGNLEVHLIRTFHTL